MLSGDQMPAATRILTASSDAIAAAAACLRAGGLVAFPTETVYGLGADAGNGEAIARLYAAKGRPTFNPLIAHVANTSAARRLADFDDAATRLAVAFWRGPLTLVLPKLPSCRVADLALAGLHRPAARGPATQPPGPRVAQERGACVSRSARPHRSGHRRRPLRGRRGVHHRRLSDRTDAAAPGRFAARRARSRTRPGAGRW